MQPILDSRPPSPTGASRLGAGQPVAEALPPNETTGTPRLPLHDMHCHLGLMTNGREVALEAARAGSLLFDNGVVPGDFDASRTLARELPNVVSGLGFHPWWVPTDRGELVTRIESFEARVAGATYIGEVGLDFGKQHLDTAESQLAVFRKVTKLAATQGARLLSIHAVRSVPEVLAILAETECLESCACVIHWFSGSNDDLQAAIRAGCLFSIGPMMVRTRRGAAYARTIPADRVLLETDAPPSDGTPYSYDELSTGLAMALDAIEARGMLLAEQISRRSRQLLLGEAS